MTSADTHHLTRSALLAGLSCILLAVPGCLDRHGPVSPRLFITTLRTIWPSEDGRSWSYQVADRTFTDGMSWTIYASPAAVPPAPPMTGVAALLDTLPVGNVYLSGTASFGLRFDGLITTRSGVTKQNLVETLVPTTAAGAAQPAAGGPGAFLAQLYRVRPDLRPLLRARLEPSLLLADTTHTYASLLLHGYAWEKTARWIGTYGDVDTLLAWKFLTSDLAPGGEFSHRLVPSLATDIWLHGRILGRQTVRTHAGTFANALVCTYLIDFGITALVDESGNVTGYTRIFSYGSVAYVNTVGPVACYERRMVSVGGTSLGAGDVTLDLTAQGPLPLATAR